MQTFISLPHIFTFSHFLHFREPTTRAPLRIFEPIYSTEPAATTETQALPEFSSSLNTVPSITVPSITVPSITVTRVTTPPLYTRQQFTIPRQFTGPLFFNGVPPLDNTNEVGDASRSPFSNSITDPQRLAVNRATEDFTSSNGVQGRFSYIIFEIIQTF